MVVNEIVYWHYSNYDKFLESTTLFSDMELKEFCSINIATYAFANLMETTR